MRCRPTAVLQVQLQVQELGDHTRMRSANVSKITISVAVNRMVHDCKRRCMVVDMMTHARAHASGTVLVVSPCTV